MLIQRVEISISTIMTTAKVQLIFRKAELPSFFPLALLVAISIASDWTQTTKKDQYRNQRTWWNRLTARVVFLDPRCVYLEQGQHILSGDCVCLTRTGIRKRQRFGTTCTRSNLVTINTVRCVLTNAYCMYQTRSGQWHNLCTSVLLYPRVVKW